MPGVAEPPDAGFPAETLVLAACWLLAEFLPEAATVAFEVASVAETLEPAEKAEVSAPMNPPVLDVALVEVLAEVICADC